MKFNPLEFTKFSKLFPDLPSNFLYFSVQIVKITEKSGFLLNLICSFWLHAF